MKLSIKSFALACGIFWGIGVFVATWWIIAFNGATREPTILGLVYLGFNISPAGSVIGFAWALVDGLICGAIFAWLYNTLTSRRLVRET